MLWLSAYLFRSSGVNSFLLDAVKPFIDSMIALHWIDAFFFVRFSEGGPHIRLRMKGEHVTLLSEVKPALNSCCQTYFRRYPSHGAGFPVAQEPQGDSIRYVPYSPEIDRYGGELGMTISERQFEASSRAVLSRLSDGWDFQTAIGMGIHMHIALAHCFGMNLSTASQFFSYVSKRSFLAGEDEDRMQELFRAQRISLVQANKVLWCGLEDKARFDIAWLDRWIEDLLQVASDLKNTQLVRNHDIQLLHGIGDGDQILWPILASYVHMTNNRLGILRTDESYVSYLIAHSLDELFAEEKHE